MVEQEKAKAAAAEAQAENAAAAANNVTYEKISSGGAVMPNYTIVQPIEPAAPETALTLPNVDVKGDNLKNSLLIGGLALLVYYWWKRKKRRGKK